MVTNTTVELVETGEQRDRIGRRITPAGRRTELVAAWRASGLTQTAFARREGIIYSSFASWVQAARLPSAKRRSAKAKPPAPPVRFLAASLPSSASAAPVFAVCVRLPDGTELRGQSGRELAELLRVLRK